MTETSPTWAELRQKHEDLVRRLATPSRGLAADIETYVGDLARSGASLGDYDSRLLAQTMLNYWTAEWVALTGGLDRLDPPVLSDFAGTDPKQAGQNTDATDVKLIRLAAAARLWKESGRKPGYLLTGDTIEDAAGFAKQDADIAELVQASRDYRREKFLRTVKWIATPVLIVALTVLSIVFVPAGLKASGTSALLSSTADANWSDRVVKSAFLHLFKDKRPTCDPTTGPLLHGLSLVQKVSIGRNSAFDFSKATLPKICADGIVFRMITFANAAIDSGSFRKADLPNSVFADASLAQTDFEGANLRFAQFKGVRAPDARFDGSALFRASFDGATLKGASFRGADLRKASFAGAIFGPEFPASFSGTAWWLAEGWTPEQQARLAKLDGTSLRDSEGYKAVIAEDIEAVTKAAPRTADRAGSLNALAWSLARFGEDLSSSAATGVNLVCPADTPIPTTALEAANGAVCIARALKLGDRSIGNFLDTQGYVLLQLEQPEAALHALQLSFDKTGARDTQFRLGVAQFAMGRESDGLENVKSAMVEGHYQPTHELQRLKSSIKGNLAALIDQSGSEGSCRR